MKTIYLLQKYKKRSLAIAMSATLIVSSSQAFAEDDALTKEDLETGAVIGSAGLVGALVGGPLGFVAGVMGSALVKDQVDRHEAKAVAIKNADEKIVDLEQELLKEQENSNDLTELVNQRLSLEILFETGLDDPSIADLEKLRELSLFLLSNPSFTLNLSGHADHRGTDEYNNVLALERAKSVATALNDYGIPDSLISVKGYGSDKAKSKADAAELALDRRVDIEIVFNDAESSGTEAQIVDTSF